MVAETARPAAVTSEQVRRLPIVALLAANLISVVGNMLTLIALPWFVLVTTGSAARTGMAGFFFVLPAFREMDTTNPARDGGRHA